MATCCKILEASLLPVNHANDYNAILALENNMDPLAPVWLYAYI